MSKEGEVWDYFKISKIKNALMSLAIFSDNARSIKGKFYRSIHNPYIMDKLIKSALQKGRINCHKGFKAFFG